MHNARHQTPAELTQSQNSLAGAVERQREAVLPHLQQRWGTAIPPSCARYWDVTDSPLRSKQQVYSVTLWKQVSAPLWLWIQDVTRSIYLLQGFLVTELYIYSLLHWFLNLIILWVYKFLKLRSQNICATFLSVSPLSTWPPKHDTEALHHIWNTTELFLTATVTIALRVFTAHKKGSISEEK